MNKNLKIKLVKAYQSVKFEGAENSYFTATEFKSTQRDSKPLVDISRTELGSVIVKSSDFNHATGAFNNDRA